MNSQNLKSKKIKWTIGLGCFFAGLAYLQAKDPVPSSEKKVIQSNISTVTQTVKDKLTTEDSQDWSVDQIQKFVNSSLKLLEDQENFYVQRLLDVTIHSLITVFPKSEYPQMYTEENFVKTLKQVSCLYVAETSYGSPPDNKPKCERMAKEKFKNKKWDAKNQKQYQSYIQKCDLRDHLDDCDQDNIGQIYGAAFKEIKRGDHCKYNNEQLEFLGPQMTCSDLHPLERPLCCPELEKLDSKTISSSKIDCRPKSKDDICMTKEQLSFVLRYHQENNSVDPLGDPSNSAPVKVKDLVKTCTNFTSDKKTQMVPAVKEHSIFASILYLKINNYKPMSDENFKKFAPEKYNRASQFHQDRYRLKVETCLNILNEKENTYMQIKNIENQLNGLKSQMEHKNKIISQLKTFGQSSEIQKKIEINQRELAEMKTMQQDLQEQQIQLKNSGAVDVVLQNIKNFETNHNIKIIESRGGTYSIPRTSGASRTSQQGQK